MMMLPKKRQRFRLIGVFFIVPLLIPYLPAAQEVSHEHTFPLSPAKAEDPTAAQSAIETDRYFIPVKLTDMVITATRKKEKAFDLPYSVKNIGEKTIRERCLSPTLPEVFAEDAGIMVQKTSRGQGSPFIRGFTGFRTLLLIDGIRLNNSVFRDGPNEYWNLVDPFLISRLEVVKGPGSVLYGSDAIGGTVNAFTKAEDIVEKEFHYNRRAFYRYSSADHGHVSRLELQAGAAGCVNFYSGLSWKDFHDMTGGRNTGLQPKTGYDEIDGDVKLTYFPGQKSKFILAYQHTNQDDVWRTHKTVYGKSWQGTTVGNEKLRSLDHVRQLAYVQYQARDTGAFINQAKFSFSFQRQEEEQFRIRGNDQSDRRGFDVRTLGFWSQIETTNRFGCWIYGLEYYHDWIDSFRHDYHTDGSLKNICTQGPVGDEASYDLLGLFVQNDITLLDRFKATVGLRYTYAKAEAGKVADPYTGQTISISDRWDNVVGSARLLCHLNEQVNLLAGVSQGFRAPNLSDLTRFDSARSDEIETPSPGLDPENFLSFEIGLKLNSKQIAGEAVYFYTKIDDMIDRYPTGNIVDGDKEIQKANVGDGFILGAELQMSCSLAKAWTLHYAVSWLYGELDTFPDSDQVKSRRPMSRISPLCASLGLIWENISETYWTEARLTMAAKQDRLSPRDMTDRQRIPPAGTPGYVVFGLRGGVNITSGLTLSAIIENITDQDYRIHGSGQNEPGSNFLMSLDWRF